MRIGIGLPNPVPDTDGATLVEWARRAEESGFSSLATIDRIVYPSYDSLISLAAAAAVTERIGLMTNILIAPLRDEVLLAKEAASVDRLSAGRLTLGLAAGGRRDDFSAVGDNFETRGRRLDQQIEVMNRVWRGELLSNTGQASVPLPGREVPILIGGSSANALERTVKYGIGYTAGGGGPDMMAPIVEKVRDRGVSPVARASPAWWPSATSRWGLRQRMDPRSISRTTTASSASGPTESPSRLPGLPSRSRSWRRTSRTSESTS